MSDCRDIIRRLESTPIRQITIAVYLGLVLCLVNCGEELPTDPTFTPSQLAFSVQPTTAIEADTIAPSIQVAVQDAQGNTVTSATTTITLAITGGTGTANATLSGTLSQTAQNGLAVFNDIAIDAEGIDYTLSATAPNLTGAVSAPFDIDPRPLPPTVIILESDQGDYIGGGVDQQYTLANARITVLAFGNRLSVGIEGDEWWSGDFVFPDSLSRPEVGEFTNLTRAPFHDAAVGGLSWSGEGRGCNTLTGWFAVDSLRYSSAILEEIHLRFEQHCEGDTPALHGSIHWELDDPTEPPGPVLPIPTNLWQPAQGSIPTSGNYIYLNSEVGDYIGQGQTMTYSPADAIVTLSVTDAHLTIEVRGDERWGGDFQAMSSLTQLEPGYYPDLQRWAFANPAKGGLDWSGEGRGCNTSLGWMAIDSIVFTGDSLTYVDLRFEQHCEEQSPALRGAIHWNVADSTSYPEPVLPIPGGLWQPAPGSVPPTGNYVYLDSEAGDYIGQGQTFTYSHATATIDFDMTNASLFVGVDGVESWSGVFKAMYSLSQLEQGYYPDIKRYASFDLVKGGLIWSAYGRSCTTVTGWFAIDSIAFTGDSLDYVDLRFEQHCDDSTPALRGAIHYDIGDAPASPVPVKPIPGDLR